MIRNTLCSHISVPRQGNQGSVQTELRTWILQAVNAILQDASCHFLVSLTTQLLPLTIKAFGILQTNRADLDSQT